MRKPIGWNYFSFGCELHNYRMTNMIPESKCSECKRGTNKDGENLSCHYNVCPKLKELRKQLKIENRENEIEDITELK